MQYCTIFMNFLQYFFEKIFAFFNNLEIFSFDCEYFENISAFSRNIRLFLLFRDALAFILSFSAGIFVFFFHFLYNI